MKKSTARGMALAVAVAHAAIAGEGYAECSADLSAVSPDGRIRCEFSTGSGGMKWSLSRDGRTLVRPSKMGFRFAAGNPCGKESVDLSEMKVVGVRRSQSDATWNTSLYRRENVRDRYNELMVELEETESRTVRTELGNPSVRRAPRRMDIAFRAYDEGVAFRYSFPQQDAFDGFEIQDELTEWRFAQDAMGWTTTYADERNSQEEQYVRGLLSAVDKSRYIGMPVLVETQGGTLALCEAALSNWAGLCYRAVPCDGDACLVASLSKILPSSAATPNVAVIASTPAASPWRVVIVGDDEVDLLRKNDIIVNLNPPPDPLIDFSFVKPGASTWDWWTESNNSLSTELAIRLVDFASEMGWPYHTIDGGWYGFARRPNHGPNVSLEPRRGFDLERIVAHAREKGVGIWVWIHWMEIEETGIEETFSRLEQWGVVGVKTDFLNRQDQEMVNWCERVCRSAARHRIMVNFHGSFKSTGGERTWPNMITREAVLGNEMNIFRKVVTPTHCATLPFTRFLLGPADFTPGGFGNVHSRDFVPQVRKGHRYGDETDRCPHWAEEMGTRAHAIAQCVQFDSPIMTLCDWPERYRGADGMEALRNLPTTWRNTHPVAGRCGEFYAVVRETHDGRFYYAATTTNRRKLDLDLDFLGDGEWEMSVYADDPTLTPSDAKAISVSTRSVRRGERVSFALCDEGGAVAIFVRVGGSGRMSSSTAGDDAAKMNSGMMNPGSALGTVERIDDGGAFKVLVYGNSIALHGPKSDIGWTNNWGMAASAPEKDFAHLVVAGLEAKLGKRADFRIRNLAALERNFTTNIATVSEIAVDAKWRPDYVVVSVGENVRNVGEADAPAYRKFLADIARPFADAGARIVMRSPFWANEAKAKCTEDAAADVGAAYVDAGPLGSKAENKAIGIFSHAGVANHPGDLGMRRLADLILAAFVTTATPRFEKAEPVWARGQAEEMNSSVRFRAAFDAGVGAGPFLRITGTSAYRIRLNGRHVGYGPARSPKGFFRVDEWPLGAAMREGRNELEIDASGYNCNSYYLLGQPAFLQAEVVADGKVLAATAADGGGFSAESTERMRKVPRYSFQRTFAEAYRYGSGTRGLPLERRPDVRCIERIASDPCALGGGRLATGTTGVPPVANGQDARSPSSLVTLHRLVLVFHGGDCVLSEEV